MAVSPDIENLKWVLDRTTDAVKTADNKNSIVTAVLAGLAAVLFSNDNFSSAVSVIGADPMRHWACCALLSLMAASFTAAILSLVASLFPRVSCENDSLIYYGLIAEHKDWHSLKREMDDKGFATEEDLISQIHINSSICKKKMFWHSVALVFTYALILLTCGFAACFMIGG